MIGLSRERLEWDRFEMTVIEAIVVSREEPRVKSDAALDKFTFHCSKHSRNATETVTAHNQFGSVQANFIWEFEIFLQKVFVFVHFLTEICHVCDSFIELLIALFKIGLRYAKVIF